MKEKEQEERMIMGIENNCNINKLKENFPSKFEPWTSEGEQLLSDHGCDIIAIPTKNVRSEHLVGQKINSNIFIANGYIRSSVTYDDEKDKWIEELGTIHSFRKEKIVLSGQNNSGTILSFPDANKIISNLNKIVKGY